MLSISKELSDAINKRSNDYKDKLAQAPVCPEFISPLDYSTKIRTVLLNAPMLRTELKYDGVRCKIVVIVDVESGTPVARAMSFSRAGNVFKSTLHIEEEAMQIALYMANNHSGVFTFDGELCCKNADNGIPSGTDFTTSSGMARRGEPQEALRFVCWEIAVESRGEVVVVDDWVLYDVLTDKPRKYIYTVDYPEVTNAKTNEEIIDDGYTNAVEAGAEGVVYKCGNLWVRRKTRHSGTFMVTGYAFGDGRLSATIGSITIADSLGRTTRLGTGFTDEHRRDMMQRRTNDLIGSLVEVQYKAYSPVGGALREPSFKGFRETGETTVDSFTHYIKEK